jgi:prepilin signal peptidase PulO-like enzyme (type II secretory pathway)
MFINFSGWNYLAPIIFYLPFYLLWKISNGTWIGLGDGKLVFGFGGFLGLVHGASAIILGFWVGAVIAIFIMLIDRLRKSDSNITMKTEIPFGPFLIAGFLIVYFLGLDVTGISNYLNAFS